jgi:hypothetical protein
MSYEESMRILLTGICGINAQQISKGTGVSHVCILQFYRNQTKAHYKTIDKLAWFIWKKMNENVLLSPEELD